MLVVKDMKEKILRGELLSKDDVLKLIDITLDELAKAADDIRKHFCGDTFDICTIINGKSGKCSENCKFCAQSSFYKTNIKEYPLLDSESIVKEAKYNSDKGVLRYAIVTSGKRLSDDEVESVCKSIKDIRKSCDISVCGSFGLLSEGQYKRLKEAGLTRIHNNMETSKRNFENVCTTHTIEDKIQAINNAKRAGLSVCSGGIIGLSETMEDRIDMAFTIRELGVKSIPLNVLNPIKGTPFENNKKISNDELCRVAAIYRFILPDSFIRLAGGRGLLPDKGEKCFLSGANAAISGDMLTTSGITIDEDMKMLKRIGYNVKLIDD